MVGPLAEINDRQRDRLLSLLVVKAQRLRRPAGDRQIALPADPLDLESRAQPVVAADVIAAHEGAVGRDAARIADAPRSEEHTSELQSLMRISYAVFCL